MRHENFSSWKLWGRLQVTYILSGFIMVFRQPCRQSFIYSYRLCVIGSQDRMVHLFKKRDQNGKFNKRKPPSRHVKGLPSEISYLYFVQLNWGSFVISFIYLTVDLLWLSGQLTAVVMPGRCLHLSRPMGKPTICIGENKGADQLRGDREADQRLCFRYTDTCSTIPPLLNYKISSF